MKTPADWANLILNDLPQDAMEEQSEFLIHMVRKIQTEQCQSPYAALVEWLNSTAASNDELAARETWRNRDYNRGFAAGLYLAAAEIEALKSCEYERLERREIIAMRAQRDRAIGVLAIMVFHFGNPKRDEWLNDEGFEAAKAAVDAARKLLKGK